jgi:hypothetical protein
VTSAARDTGRVPVDHVVSLLCERLYRAISRLALLPIGVLVITVVGLVAIGDIVLTIKIVVH